MSKKEVSFLSANDKFQKSKYEESLKIINTVKTKDYDFYLLRSKIYFSINDFYLSLQDSNQCIKLQENNIEPYEISCTGNCSGQLSTHFFTLRVGVS